MFMVTHDGYVPCRVSVDSGDGVVHVPLESGSSLKIVSTDMQGRPVQDLRWIVSRIAVDDTLLELLVIDRGESDVVGTGSASSFRSARSDISGVAEVHGLVPGLYGLRLVSRDHAVVRGKQHRSGVFVPRESQADMCVASLYGVRLVMDGDDLVTFKADLPAGFMVQGSSAGGETSKHACWRPGRNPQVSFQVPSYV